RTRDGIKPFLPHFLFRFLPTPKICLPLGAILKYCLTINSCIMETKTKQKVTRKTAARKKASPVNSKTNVGKDTPLQVQNLDLASIAIDPDQPRKTLNGESLQQLAQSIKEYGVLQPI